MTKEHTEQETPTSKSARKREAEALKRLGADLAQRAPDVLRGLPMDDTLLEGVLAYRSMKNHGARRRQLQLIGKLLRSLSDEALAELVDAVATLDGASAQAIAQHAQLERWRERLIAEDSALTEYLDAFPSSDRQRLRQLIKQVRSASSEAARSKASRALFRTMRDG